MNLRIVSSGLGRPDSSNGSRNGSSNGAPKGPRRPTRAARIAGFILLALCLAGLYAAFAWQPCAACAAL